MRNPKHRPDRPSCCDVSDLLNEMYAFVQENPLWMETEDGLMKMNTAYSILTTICDPGMTTQDEYDFVINIFHTIREGSDK